MNEVRDRTREIIARKIYEAAQLSVFNWNWDGESEATKERWRAEADQILSIFEQYCKDNNIYQVIEGYDSHEAVFNYLLREVKFG